MSNANQSVLAQRLNGVSESATLKLNAMVQALRAQGVDVINLTAGEPDFEVHPAAKKAVIQALEQNRSKYTAAAGIPELREAVCAKTNLQQPEVASTRPWVTKNVVITNGGKQAIFNTFLALINPGDEVVMGAPYWLSYPEMVKVAQGRPVLLPTRMEEGFRILPKDLEKALESRKVKLLILNSPSNPTGAVYSRSEFQALAKVLAKFPETWVLSDEIYDAIVYTGGTGNNEQRPFVSFLDAAPELRDRCITVNGMSKSAAMTGWRIGWSVAPEALTEGLITLQGQSTSGINALAQYAALAALKLPPSEYSHPLKEYQIRRDLALQVLETPQKKGKIRVFVPQGAFYVFVDVSACLKSSEDSFGFCERLLKEANVAAVPGTPFGAPTFIRLSIATDQKSLRMGCERLAQFVDT